MEKHFIFSLELSEKKPFFYEKIDRNKKYFLGLSFDDDEDEDLLENFSPGDYYYYFEDGRRVRITVVRAIKRKKEEANMISDGFPYDWMVDSIVNNGRIIPGDI